MLEADDTEAKRILLGIGLLTDAPEYNFGIHSPAQRGYPLGELAC